jgi:signal transduction histidine kinase
VRLTAELQRANVHLTTMREQLVLAREEERRRLRRDLHDGLGPALAAHSLKVGAARRLLNRDVPAAEHLLTELSTDIEATVADIRRLVYNLRPPALDELGLLGALRRFATTMTGDAGINLMVDVPERLPVLPAAVEVAAFRIVQEALANVVRHADATTCVVMVHTVHHAAVPVLVIEVRDDGRGLPQQHRTGVGFVAMRERAAEVGGSVQVERLMPQGTAVSAALPLAVRLNEGEANDDK